MVFSKKVVINCVNLDFSFPFYFIIYLYLFEGLHIIYQTSSYIYLLIIIFDEDHHIHQQLVVSKVYHTYLFEILEVMVVVLHV